MVIVLKCLIMMFYLFSTIKGIDNIVMKVILDDGAFMFAEKNLGASAVKIEFGQYTGMILTRMSTYLSDNSTVRYCLLCHVYVGFYTPVVGCMMKTIRYLSLKQSYNCGIEFCTTVFYEGLLSFLCVYHQIKSHRRT